jgi:hypothetical protein
LLILLGLPGLIAGYAHRVGECTRSPDRREVRRGWLHAGHVSHSWVGLRASARLCPGSLSGQLTFGSSVDKEPIRELADMRSLVARQGTSTPTSCGSSAACR